MKKTICKVEYDTETAVLVEKRTFGKFGDADGYEESLYVKEDGKYFLSECLLLRLTNGVKQTNF